MPYNTSFNTTQIRHLRAFKLVSHLHRKGGRWVLNAWRRLQYFLRFFVNFTVE